MKLRISREEIQKRSLYIATPIYDRPELEYSASLDATKQLLTQEGITWDSRQTLGESAVARARNYLCDDFLRTGMTHMLFWDADIAADPKDVLLLLALADPESQHDVICGAYPKKQISWNKVRDAAKQGWADEDPSILADFVGDFFFKPVDQDPNARPNLDDPLEVTETGTGFMMIQRHVFQRFRKAYPELSYYDDAGNFHEISCFFNMEIHDKRYLTEDYNFCRLARDLGMKIWIAPRINLSHVGHFRYSGNITALAAAAEKNANDHERNLDLDLSSSIT